MKHLLMTLMLSSLFTVLVHAQISLPSFSQANGQPASFIYGLRAGLNIANVSDGASKSTQSKLGFMAGIYADNSYGRFWGMRHELSYSKQGFRFSNATASGNVNLQYIYATNLFALNIGHVFQAHAGPQVGFLVSALADTVKHLNSTNVHNFFSIKGQTNRFNLGGCAGVEVYPWKGLLLGFRYNLSFSSLNRREAASTFYTNNTIARSSASNGNIRLRHQMLQVTCGWRLGTQAKK
jgi:hypothetical protein